MASLTYRLTNDFPQTSLLYWWCWWQIWGMSSASSSICWKSKACSVSKMHRCRPIYNQSNSMMMKMIMMLITMKMMALIVLLYLRAADLALVHLPRLPRTDTTRLSRILMIDHVCLADDWGGQRERCLQRTQASNVDDEGWRKRKHFNLQCACKYVFFVWF